MMRGYTQIIHVCLGRLFWVHFYVGMRRTGTNLMSFISVFNGTYDQRSALFEDAPKPCMRPESADRNLNFNVKSRRILPVYKKWYACCSPESGDIILFFHVTSVSQKWSEEQKKRPNDFTEHPVWAKSPDSSRVFRKKSDSPKDQMVLLVVPPLLQIAEKILRFCQKPL